MAAQAKSLTEQLPPEIRDAGDISDMMCGVRDYLNALDALALHAPGGSITMTGEEFSMLLKPLGRWIDAMIEDLQQISHEPN